MHFGRDLDLPLKPLLPHLQVHQSQPGFDAPDGVPIRLGLPSWADAQWKGVIYPKGVKKSEYLSHYAQTFDFVEFNASFYGHFTAAQYQKWAAQVPGRFRFLPKIPALISHRRQLKNASQPLRQFLAALSGCTENVEAVWLQLPDTFSKLQFDALSAFVALFSQMSPGIQLMVEFRHPHWFHLHALDTETLQMLQAHGAGVVITDAQRVGYVVHGSILMPRVLLRFQAEGVVEFDTQRIIYWSKIIQETTSQGLQWYVSLHHHNPEAIPKMVHTWQQLLQLKASM